MLIMDEIVDWSERTRGMASAQGRPFPSSTKSLSLIREAKRFVVDSAAVAIIKTMMSSRSALKRASEHLFFPASNSWIEWFDPDYGGRIAVHFLGWSSASGPLGVEEIHSGVLTVHTHLHGKLQALAGMGEVALMASNTGVPFWIRPITDVGRHMEALSKVNSDSRTRFHLAQIAETEQPDPMLDEIGSMALGFIALLNSPKLVTTRYDDRAKLNKRRVTKGKFPLLAHETVRINLAAHEYEAVVGPSDGATRALYFVRAYLRVHTGQLQLIWPHWRGNPARGIRLPHYDITHNDRRNQ